MSGIPVYNQAPITPKKPSGTTPHTIAVPPTWSTPSRPADAPATTTATPTRPPTSSYHEAQPGASAFPAPTSTPSRYAPAVNQSPTATTKVVNGPPPPQPGAVPSLHNDNASHSTRPSQPNIPPPPRAGETTQAVAHQPAQYPTQMGIPPPVVSYGGVPPAGTTQSSTVASSSYSVPLPFPDSSTPRQSLDHPPGYVQNTEAQTMSASQRRASEVQAATNAQNSSYSYSNYIGGGGGAGSGSSSTFESSNTPKAAFGVDPEAVWGGIKSFGGFVGKKLVETEEEVWRRVGGGK